MIRSFLMALMLIIILVSGILSTTLFACVCCRLVIMPDAGLEQEFAGISASTVSRPKLTKTGKILLGIAGASFVGVCAVTVPFLLPAARRVCLPYVPATDAQVQNVMSLLTGCEPQKLVDLGSGDGRIVIEAAKHGFQVVTCSQKLHTMIFWCFGIVLILHDN